jgi:hypothetical protein
MNYKTNDIVYYCSDVYIRDLETEICIHRAEITYADNEAEFYKISRLSNRKELHYTFIHDERLIDYDLSKLKKKLNEYLKEQFSKLIDHIDSINEG